MTLQRCCNHVPFPYITNDMSSSNLLVYSIDNRAYLLSMCTVLLGLGRPSCRSCYKRRNSWKIPMSHSWERITLPFPWVTHGKELRHLHLGLLMG